MGGLAVFRALSTFISSKRLEDAIGHLNNLVLKTDISKGKQERQCDSEGMSKPPITYLIDVWPLRGVHFQHAVDEVLQPLRVRRLWVLILCVEDGHGY